MKILLINRNHFIEGGADRVYLNTGNLLEEHNFEIAYFSTQNVQNLFSEYTEYFAKDFNPRSVGILEKFKSIKNYLYNTDASKKLSNLINQFKPDIAHIHLFYGSLSASILKTLNEYEIPVVITIHDYRLLCPANAMLDRHSIICEKCKGGKFYNCTFKRCSNGNLFYSTIISIEAYMRKFVIDPLSFIDHFIFVSEFSLNKHISFDQRFESKSSHLYNFTSSSILYEFIKGEYLLYYGRLSKEKGIVNLISAVKNTKSKLKIVGDGPQKEEILHEINGCEGIEYLGFKSGLELKELIERCSYVVVPSEWYENNPMTIVEAFSLGKPVIGAKIGGIPELVSDETGVIFESGNVLDLSDAISSAINLDINEYKRISKNCLKFAEENFSKNKHFDSLENIYQSLIRK